MMSSTDLTSHRLVKADETMKYVNLILDFK
jgi:hypothetical protein